jgi:hypothetical protein
MLTSVGMGVLIFYQKSGAGVFFEKIKQKQQALCVTLSLERICLERISLQRILPRG